MFASGNIVYHSQSPSMSCLLRRWRGVERAVASAATSTSLGGSFRRPLTITVHSHQQHDKPANRYTRFCPSATSLSGNRALARPLRPDMANHTPAVVMDKSVLHDDVSFSLDTHSD